VNDDYYCSIVIAVSLFRQIRIKTIARGCKKTALGIAKSGCESTARAPIFKGINAAN